MTHGHDHHEHDQLIAAVAAATTALRAGNEALAIAVAECRDLRAQVEDLAHQLEQKDSQIRSHYELVKSLSTNAAKARQERDEAAASGERVDAEPKLDVELSTRQIEAALCAADGMKLREIAARLGVTISTASVHLHRAYAATGERGLVAFRRWALIHRAALARELRRRASDMVDVAGGWR